MLQCVAAGAFTAHMHPFCFMRDGGNFSDVPAVGERASFYAGGDAHGHIGFSASGLRPVPRAEALRVVGDRRRSGRTHVPLSRCRSRCSEHGACVSRRTRAESTTRVDGECACDEGFAGDACEQAVPTAWCWNSCSGRGRCVGGSCRCDPPFYGPGCAYLGERQGAVARTSNRSRLKVHVYDLPALWLQRRSSYASDDDPIFSTYHVFLSALLSDPSTLAADPEHADLFVVPAFGTNMDGLQAYYEHALAHVAREHGGVGRRHAARNRVIAALIATRSVLRRSAQLCTRGVFRILRGAIE